MFYTALFQKFQYGHFGGERYEEDERYKFVIF